MVCWRQPILVREANDFNRVAFYVDKGRPNKQSRVCAGDYSQLLGGKIGKKKTKERRLMATIKLSSRNWAMFWWRKYLLRGVCVTLSNLVNHPWQRAPPPWNIHTFPDPSQHEGMRGQFQGDEHKMQYTDHRNVRLKTIWSYSSMSHQYI